MLSHNLQYTIKKKNPFLCSDDLFFIRSENPLRRLFTKKEKIQSI